MRQSVIYLGLLLVTLAASGCIVVSHKRTKVSSEVTKRLVEERYLPRPDDHPIDVWLGKLTLQEESLSDIPNKKDEGEKPKDAITLIRVDLSFSGDQTPPDNLNQIIKKLTRDARAEGGDAIAMISCVVIGDIEEYTFEILRYRDKP